LEITDDEETTTTMSKSVTIKELWSITLPKEHTRPVQTVEDTIVDDHPNVSETIEDPDMVAGRPASVLFKLEGQQIDKLSDDETVPLEVSTDTGTTVTSELRGKEIRELTYGPDEEPEDVEKAKILANGPKSKRPPVFNLNAGTTTLTVSVGENDDHGDTVDLSSGTDFETTESRALRIGFIEIRAPKDEIEESGWAYGHQNKGRMQTDYSPPGVRSSNYLEDISGSDREEKTKKKFNKIVDESKQYLKRVYPVTNIETRTIKNGGNPMEGVKRDSLGGIYTEYLHIDLWKAHEELTDQFNDLDATVAITPPGYFEYHEDSGVVSVHVGASDETQPPLAVGVKDQGNVGWTASTVAHEIGHHLEGAKAYPKPLAQQNNPDLPFFRVFVDRLHARTEELKNDNGKVIDKYALRSTAFNLFDGTFSVLREGATRKGPSGPRSDRSNQ
jgi:hypothetical protein